jgi:hypothetical protein
MQKRSFVIGLLSLLVAMFFVSAVNAQDMNKAVKFKVRVENVSKDLNVASNGEKWPFALSPGFFVVGNKLNLFKEGQKASAALEAQAEDGNPAMFAEMLNMNHASGAHGVFNTPVGAMGAGPLVPGNVYEFEVTAVKGQKLYMVAMFGQSNDLFYSLGKDGVELFDKKGNALTQDVTDKLMLWDAGTEVNEEPGIGANQAPRQKMANTGTAENGKVSMVKDGFKYPATKDVLKVTVTPVQ